MLNCRARLWRCAEALDAPAHNAPRLHRNVHPPTVCSQQRRLLSTSDEVVRRTKWAPRYQPEVEKLSRRGEEPWKLSAMAANQQKKIRAGLHQPLAKKIYETPNLARIGKRDPSISERDWNNRLRELRHLQDPLELAQFVKSELRKDREAEMWQLVRMASHSMQCVVSWNHIIDHYLAKERVSDALKVYNDVRCP
jgi:pentatricopeptide repeat protein